METKRSKKELATMLLVGVMVGLMLTGTAFAASYLTKSKGQKLFLENTKTYVDTTFTVPAASSLTGQVDCPAGWQATGGGIQPLNTDSPDLTVRWSAPVVASDNLVAASDGKNPASTGWAARLANSNGVSAYTFAVGVICSK